MQEKRDSVDSALESLGGRSWPEDYGNNQLQEKIMNQYHTNSSPSRPHRRGALVATLAFVALGTTGFATVGGFEMLRGWLITVEVDGESATVDPDNIHIKTEGNTATITVDGIEGDVEDGATVTVTATREGDGNSTTILDADGNMIKTIKPDDTGEQDD